jgi:hypothetical protein
MILFTLTEKAAEIAIAKLIASINWDRVAQDLKLKGEEAIDSLKKKAGEALRSILIQSTGPKYYQKLSHQDNGIIALVNRYGVFLFAGVKMATNGTVKKVSDSAYILSEHLTKHISKRI